MPKLKLKVDITEFTLGDLEAIDGMAHGETSIREAREIMEQYVEIEGDPGAKVDFRDLPATTLLDMVSTIMNAYGDAIEAARGK